MSRDKQELFDLLTELWNTANSDLITDVYTENVERTDPSSPEPNRGRQQIADYISAIHSSFPDFKIEMKKWVIEEIKSLQSGPAQARIKVCTKAFLPPAVG